MEDQGRERGGLELGMSGSLTFVLDLAVGNPAVGVVGGVALVGAEVGLRRPDVEPLPQHRLGPELQRRRAIST